MGVGRVFPGGALGNFSKIFQGGKSEEICFFPYETKKTTSFAKIFWILFRRPWLLANGTYRVKTRYCGSHERINDFARLDCTRPSH